MFRILVYIFETFRAYLIFALFVTLSVALMTQNNNKQIRALQSFAIAFIGYTQDAFSFLPNPFALERQRNTLQELNVSLSEEVSFLRSAALENLHLRTMLAFRERSNRTLVAADIVGKNIHLMRNTITLNIGKENGIKQNMPIITETGLVGRIIAVSDNYSLGQILLHRESRVSATVERSRVNGIVAWNGGLQLVLKNIVKSVDIKPGDRIVTSPFSSLYPRNIEIGIVSSVYHVPETIFQEVGITPSVDFATVERVFVIISKDDSERNAFEQTNAANRQDQ